MQIRYPYLNETISYSQFYSVYVVIPICIVSNNIELLSICKQLPL